MPFFFFSPLSCACWCFILLEKKQYELLYSWQYWTDKRKTEILCAQERCIRPWAAVPYLVHWDGSRIECRGPPSCKRLALSPWLFQSFGLSLRDGQLSCQLWLWFFVIWAIIHWELARGSQSHFRNDGCWPPDLQGCSKNQGKGGGRWVFCRCQDSVCPFVPRKEKKLVSIFLHLGRLRAIGIAFTFFGHLACYLCTSNRQKSSDLLVEPDGMFK